MAKAGRGKTRRDSKNRILRPGESVRANGKYQYKYHIDGKPHFVYSWKLEPTDRLPPGKLPCLSLRELEKQVNADLERLLNISDGQMTVCELVDRYLKTKISVREGTKAGYVTVQRVLAKEPFGQKKIRTVKTSDAKLFLIKLQQEDGKSFSSIHNIRGVLRPAFQMAVDDEMLTKNPFQFHLSTVVVNDSVKREALSPADEKRFLDFVKDDPYFSRYYDGMFILFNTGLRISEFCGLTKRDIDFENSVIYVDHQLQRTRNMECIIESTKTTGGTRRIPMSEEVREAFERIIANREKVKKEPMIDGHSGFLFLDKDKRPMVAQHWQNYFKRAVKRYNSHHRLQLPSITPHICRHTYCSKMARAGMNPKALQYLMGHAEISVTMNVYTHLGEDDAREEMIKMGLIKKDEPDYR